MEDVNTTSATKQQQQQQHQSQQKQQHNQQQQQPQHSFGTETQQNNDFQQQFCLRWHNHQTSLLSTLPVLLDQSHLTDVTISAEGKNLQAHRIVLSACSSFFLELFRNLEANNHPVVIIPGASFAAIDALLTFMYSGEVNVYEDQIPTLLSLAETLGIKGLADVQNNESPNWRNQKFEFLASPNEEVEVQKSHETAAAAAASPESTVAPSSASPLPQTPINLLPIDCSTTLPELSLHTQFRPPNLENIFLKSLQLYPNLLPQPLNFSQISVNKTNEFLAKYQQHLYPNAFSGILPTLSSTLAATANDNKNRLILTNDNNCPSKRFCSGDRKLPLILQQQKDIKRIDKIVEGLRSSNKSLNPELTTNQPQQKQNQQQQIYAKSGTTSAHNTGFSHMTTRNTFFNEQQQQQQQQQQRHVASIAAAAAAAAYMANEEQHQKQQQQQQQQINEQFSALTPTSAESCVDTQSQLEALPSLLMSTVAASANNTVTMPSITPATATKAYASNSKLYATCFICNKQLSNQYNLRVHLETHQNVRYACNVCTHVSRSKDALRKHVSYRHPGAPSPCETEARRKRATKAACLNANATSMQFETTTTTATNSIATTTNTTTTTTTTTTTPHSPITTTSSEETLIDAAANELTKRNHALETDNNLSIAAQLNNAYMFFPNQLHFAAAVAATQQQQQQQQQQERKCKLESKSHLDLKNVLSEISSLTTEAKTPITRSISTENTPESTAANHDLQNKDEMLKKSLSVNTSLASPTITP